MAVDSWISGNRCQTISVFRFEARHASFGVIPLRLTMSKRLLFLVLTCLLVLSAQAKPILVVTTTLISSAVQDLAGDAFEIETLMPAGTCPGQFDMEPMQAAKVAKASLIIRHEMQGFLDKLFVAAGADKSRIIAPRGGFNVPAAYLAYCEKLAFELSRRHPELAPRIQQGLTELKSSLASLATELQGQAAPLRGTKVVCALFQSELARWLGLEIVTTFPPSEDPSPALLREAISMGEKQAALLVLGNVQNGDRVPRAIAKALGKPCVMLGNFPIDAAAGAQARLMRENLKQLQQALVR